MQIEMFLIIVAIFLCVSLWIFHDLIYERWYRKGFKEGLHTFEELHKDMVAGGVGHSETDSSCGQHGRFDQAGIKSIEDVIDRIDKAERFVNSIIRDDDYVEDAIVGALSGGVSSEPDAGECDGDILDDLDDEFIGGQIIGPLAERGAEESECDCKRCVFAETPYCEKCSFIALAGGGESKPSHYQEAGEISPEQDSAANIKAMIDKGEVIPLRIVNWYNAMARRKP